ncbi:MAG: hypothetical protein QW228_06185 [Candidatus Aenigmatarchaeota archaeon]
MLCFLTVDMPVCAYVKDVRPGIVVFSYNSFLVRDCNKTRTFNVVVPSKGVYNVYLEDKLIAQLEVKHCQE